MLPRTRIRRRLGRLGEILAADHFPAVAPYIQWMRSPLGSLTLASIASALCGLVLHPQAFVIFFGLLTLLGVGLVWPWLGVRGLVGALSFDRERIREGESATARLVLQNRMPWGAWGLLVEGGLGTPSGSSTSREGDPEPGLAIAPGWRTTVATWEFTPGHRGVYPARAPRIASGFPFGLRKVSRPLSAPNHLLVWPRTFPVAMIPETASGRTSEGLASRNTAGTSGDVLGVRPYRRGDSLRRIHWSQTARHDRLVICEQQSHASPQVQIVLDTHDAAHTGAGPSGSREWAIRIAASFLERWIEQGAEVEAVFEGQVIAPRDASIAARRAHALDALAQLEPTGSWSLADVLDLPVCRRYQAGLRVIVTTDVGLRRFPFQVTRDPRERLVVLKASAFADTDTDADAGDAFANESAPPPASAWIWVDDPARVPNCLRRAWKEVPVGC